ncbi:SURF1 family cytochrome oxidase biogenesis protein [Corynebacterium heidelbergense]|uniref:SURF1-like protein n=1 Tax=Corynebacterium heidelbergense TaxID=2055947 RepID=A0A364VBC8_9CORY|nr:SURF1 family cytochrome oxidase biogenesis protein [Corynebacterium heidelbergense]RAV33960.1 hypothetical protein CWC39_05680 [Corynebacterium heidelbergense]WCZ36305.1 SURF1 family protein [Corynebacterium heidelbergense]
MATTRKPRTSRGGWRSFFTPGWALTVVLVIAFSYLAFSVLAPWQLGKNERRSASNDRLSSAVTKDPVPVTDVLPRDGSSAGEGAEWTHVKLQGHFIPDAEVLLRNRPVNSTPAFHILTPFAVDGGPNILVDRGWVESKNGSEVPEFAPTSAKPTTVTGFVQMPETAQPGSEATSGHHRLVNSIDPKNIGQTSGLALAADYIQLDDGSAHALATQSAQRGETGQEVRPIPLPQLDAGPYLSYGIQWIAFGIIAPLGLGWFVYSELRERRREREEREALGGAAEYLGGAGQPGVADQPGVASPAEYGATDGELREPGVREKSAHDAATELKLQDRYGTQRKPSRFGRSKTPGNEERF